MYGYIYETTNLVNGKKYIGQKKSKVFLDTKYLGSGIKIVKAVKKYGKENFEVKLIEECETPEELDEREEHWITVLRTNYPSNMIYNIADGGRVNRTMTGERNPLHHSHYTFTKEHRQNISNSLKGRRLSPKVIENLRKMNTNRVPWNKNKKGVYTHSDEIRQKISNSRKGIKFTEEHRRHISESLKGSKINENTRLALLKANTGRIMTDETKKKISEANKISHAGIKHSKETIEKIANSNRGKKRTEEQRKRISESLKGKKRNKPMSQEQRDKIGKAVRERWEKQRKIK